MMKMKISLGGEGENVEVDLTVSGCSCLVEDFVPALISFANQWKKEADEQKAPKPKPCGCKDA
jgi:hypothetical protein